MAKHIWQCLCHQIIENTQDAVIFADSDGIIRMWNSGAESIFGYSSDEALGETLDLIIPEKHRKRHLEGYKNVMNSGISSYDKRLLAVPSLRKDGERISVEFSIVILRDPETERFGAAAIIRDVTLRWQEERALKQHFSLLMSKARELADLVNKNYRFLKAKIACLNRLYELY
ncbi:MAG: PAS domain S-box protein [Deltaproteobacteria bacterium]